MNKSSVELSLEQEFNHQVFAEHIKQLSREQAQELLIELHRQMLYKDNIYRALFLSQEKDITNSLFSTQNN